MGDVGDDGGDDREPNSPLLVVVLLADDGVGSPSPKTSLGGQMKNPLAGGLADDPCWALDPDAVGRPVFHNCGIFTLSFEKKKFFRFFLKWEIKIFNYATRPLNDLT